MYIDIVPNRNSPPAILLRESYREGKKVKKRTVANLSGLPMEKIEALRSALSGKPVTSFSDSPESGPIWAVLDVLNQIAEELGFDEGV